MTIDEIPSKWSRQFGLAVSPLFEEAENASSGDHQVFLDGGQGTFVLSTSDREVWREEPSAAWAWSSDIAHHVTVTPSVVAVVRWDDPANPRIVDRDRVERSLDEFYRSLSSDRVRSTRTVVYHLLNLFRRIRSLTATAGIPDWRSTDIFLYSLASLLSQDDVVPDEWGLDPEAPGLFGAVRAGGMANTLAEFREASESFGQLTLFPELAVRHAGGLLFQEAHFELIRAPAVDMFDHVSPPETAQITRGGSHFTPPALARSVVEQVLAQIQDLSVRKALVICDPACGSGVFLHEALRALRRASYSGRVVLCGNDVSQTAIAMARFALNRASRDWSPKGGVEIKLTVGDSLEVGAIPRSDVILMNPPFISWGAQSAAQRAQLVQIAGKDASRGDLSMAFVLRAFEALESGGVLGVLFPASLLSQLAASGWRKRLMSEFDVRFLASIGDYGLFAYALVRPWLLGMTRVQREMHSVH